MIFTNATQHPGLVRPPFCKFNILSSSPCAHVLKRSIDPDRLSPSPFSNACQSEITRNNSGNAPLSEKRTHVSRWFWKRELFPFCRAYWSAVTKCPRSTCLWRTSYTTWGTTLAIRSFNADVTMIFSSCGCNGAPRYKTHRAATKSYSYILPHYMLIFQSSE